MLNGNEQIWLVASCRWELKRLVPLSNCSHGKQTAAQPACRDRHCTHCCRAMAAALCTGTALQLLVLAAPPPFGPRACFIKEPEYEEKRT
jgi:hypothetical protein